MNYNFIHYYQSEFPNQQYKLLSVIPCGLIHLLEKYNMIIAGGAITSIFSDSPIKDLDVYPRNPEYLKSFKKEFIELIKDTGDTGDGSKYTSANAETFLYKKIVVQAISKMADNVHVQKSERSPEDILGKFDWTVCMGAFDFKNHEFILYNKFLADLAMRRLIFNCNTDYPICSLHRLTKYEKKGFHIQAGEIVKLSLCIAKLKMNSYADLKDQLMGIDTLIFEELTTDLIDNHGSETPIDYNKVMEEINHKLNRLWESEEVTTQSHDYYSDPFD